jgi:hypothetical protein
MIQFIACVFILAACCATAFAQPSKRAEIKRIDAYAKTLDNYAKRNKNSNLVFADVSDYDQAKSKWKKFASSKEFEKFRETTEVYDIANVWQRIGKYVLAVRTLSSPSGDWAKYVSMYFRPDGTIARSESELRTFYGELIVRQNFHFNAQGKLLRRTKEYFDLATGKPKMPEGDTIGAQKGFIDEDNYFLTTKKLPFAHLLKLR